MFESRPAKIGVMLINLGSPRGTDYGSLCRYLRQFLSDRRVIEISRLIWKPILYSVILPSRPQKSAQKYRRIWNYARSEPPLVTITRAQAEKLQQRLEHLPKSVKHFSESISAKNAPAIEVNWAMRYGEPSIEAVCHAMMADGCEKLLLFPLYPQYCAATTASTLDACFAALKKKRHVPALRSVPSYPDNPAYIEALSASIKAQLAQLSFVPQVLIASYHGLPVSYIKRGDPYAQECQRTTQALKQALGFDETQFIMGFQSRFGREEWLQPYTEETVIRLAREGVKSLAIVNPGFVADCLETLDEMGHEVAQIFRAHGGENFAHLACLNDSEAGIDVLETLIRREISGWI